MGSDQNPIHRDRDKRGDGAQPFQDNKETLTQKDAEIGRTAPFPENQTEQLTDEQKDELARQHASDRLAEVQREVQDEDDSNQE